MAHYRCSTCGGAAPRQEHLLDLGYGYCDPCRERKDAGRKMEDTVAEALSPERRERFRAMDLPLRRGILLEMIDAGLIGWRVRRSA